MSPGNYLKRFDLTGRPAIVTGGRRGIGRAIALRLAELGAPVALFDLDGATAAEVAREIVGNGGRAEAIAVDVADAAGVEAAVARAVAAVGRPAILVNNAGILHLKRLAELAPEEWDRLMAVNVRGVYLCTRAVAPLLIAGGYGRVVNLGSSLSSRGAVFNTWGGGADYNASKAAVQAFTRTIAQELAPHGITVNAVAPITTDTPMHTGYFERSRERFTPTVPLGRLGEPEDIADAVAFLVSDAARFITGQTLHVNGGQLMVD
jgi:3-oxoacyl-[acyl-carrier protein] reductase